MSNSTPIVHILAIAAAIAAVVTLWYIGVIALASITESALTRSASNQLWLDQGYVQVCTERTCGSPIWVCQHGSCQRPVSQ